MCAYSVFALALDASCLVPKNFKDNIEKNESNAKREEVKEEDEEDQYDINEKLMNNGISLDDTGIRFYFP